MDKKQVTLPDPGHEWLMPGKEFYIILSLKYSGRDRPVFWRPGDAGYTDNLFCAGKYHRTEVEAKPDYYNNGLSTVAIPLTEDAIRLLNLTVTLDWDVLPQFFNRQA